MFGEFSANLGKGVKKPRVLDGVWALPDSRAKAVDSPAFPDDFATYRVLASSPGGQVMKRKWLLSAVAVIGMLGYGGCRDGDSPTDPASGGLNLSGAWAGRMTHYDSPACANEGISVALSQNGGGLRGSFQTSCQGMLDLRGELNGDSVSGTLSRSDGSSIGEIAGTASRTSIRITTWGPLARGDDGRRVRTVVNAIELAR
jgi:hypothetical protein